MTGGQKVTVIAGDTLSLSSLFTLMSPGPRDNVHVRTHVQLWSFSRVQMLGGVKNDGLGHPQMNMWPSAEMWASEICDKTTC